MKTDTKEPYKYFQEGVPVCEIKRFMYIKHGGIANEYIISVYDKHSAYPILRALS